MIGNVYNEWGMIKKIEWIDETKTTTTEAVEQ